MGTVHSGYAKLPFLRDKGKGFTVPGPDYQINFIPILASRGHPSTYTYGDVFMQSK